MTAFYPEQSDSSARFSLPGSWRWSDILALAGSSNVMQTARNLVRPWKWQQLDAHAQALGGMLPRRNRDPFLVQVHLSPVQFRCSCKAKNAPCAHALALLMLAVEFPDAFNQVDDGIRSTGLGAGAEEGWPASPFPVDAGADFAQGKDETTGTVRLAAARTAVESLQAWLDHLVAGGFSAAAYRSEDDWTAMSGRLIDNDLPGAAALVQQMGKLPGSSGDWPARMLQLAGRLHLMMAAVSGYAALAPTRRGDLHHALGWPAIYNEEDEVADCWRVIGTPMTRRIAPAKRTWWLYGRGSTRLARVIVPVQPAGVPQVQLPVNTDLDATLGFAHGTPPFAARIVQMNSIDSRPWQATSGRSLTESYALYTEARCANPWLQTMPALLRSVTVRRADSGWLLLDDAGNFVHLPPVFEHGWVLRSALDEPDSALFGLWNESYFAPVSLCTGGRWRELATMRGIK